MIRSFALVLLLGFELSYYLLIIQTGVVAHYHSDLIALFPMFAGGVTGTLAGGISWFGIKNPVYKIIIALCLQLYLSFYYPDYTPSMLFLLGLAVGVMAPLGIYLFKIKQTKELLLALAIAYSVGTYFFTFLVDERIWMAILFTCIALSAALLLRDYRVDTDKKIVSHPFTVYLPLMLWIFLDSNLFETLLRHEGLGIWSIYTFTIIAFHLLGLIVSRFIYITQKNQHIFIAFLFGLSYLLSYLEYDLILAMVYPFTISYYNVIVFKTLSREMNMFRLAFMMVFVGWAASGLGLAVALSRILH